MRAQWRPAGHDSATGHPARDSRYPSSGREFAFKAKPLDSLGAAPDRADRRRNLARRNGIRQLMLASAEPGPRAQRSLMSPSSASLISNSAPP